MTTTLRVLLADDHELIRSGLRGLLQATDDIRTPRRTDCRALCARSPRARRSSPHPVQAVVLAYECGLIEPGAAAA